MKRNVSVVRLIIATRSIGPPASGKIIKEIPGSVASGTPHIFYHTDPLRPWIFFKELVLITLNN
jgi:hypothetical protein